MFEWVFMWYANECMKEMCVRSGLCVRKGVCEGTGMYVCVKTNDQK